MGDSFNFFGRDYVDNRVVTRHGNFLIADEELREHIDAINWEITDHFAASSIALPATINVSGLYTNHETKSDNDWFRAYKFDIELPAAEGPTPLVYSVQIIMFDLALSVMVYDPDGGSVEVYSFPDDSNELEGEHSF